MSSKHYRSISRRDFLKLAAATTAALAVDCTRLEVLATETGPKEELPVVVIGAGLGGLALQPSLLETASRCPWSNSMTGPAPTLLPSTGQQASSPLMSRYTPLVT